MRWLNQLLGVRNKAKQRRRAQVRRSHLESLESRKVFAADALPVLMVLADQQDFYYREYSDTRQSIEASGLDVVVAATTTNPTYPHPGSGQGTSSGEVTPDIALANVNADDYSAIVFVGGWGSSMYQYAYNDPDLNGTTDNFYSNPLYNGDDNLSDGQMAPQKVVVNNLINDFLAEDKHVAGLCHGVTVLAWARVDGVSPLAGRNVAVPTTVSAPDQFYNGQWRNGGYMLGQYDQVIDNGGLASPVSGSVGDPTTAADDVIIDGRIITGENFNSAAYFGEVIADQVLANVPSDNQSPVVSSDVWTIAENSPVGTFVGQVSAFDPDAGQSHVYSIAAGNDNGALAIDPNTGVVTVANMAALDFETRPTFTILVKATDNGSPSLSGTAQIVVNLTNVRDSIVEKVGNSIIVYGTDQDDTIEIWGDFTGGVFVGVGDITEVIVGAGAGAGPHVRVFGGAGNDTIFATDLKVQARIFGEAGNDLIVGGHGNDIINGGGGVDRISGGQGNDLIRGGGGNDFLYGNEGRDVLLGGLGNDTIEGMGGFDILIGNQGEDRLRGGAGEDVLIGGNTSYDANNAALLALLAQWSPSADFATRTTALSNPAAALRLRLGDTVQDDNATDHLAGGTHADWIFSSLGDVVVASEPADRITA